MQKAPGRAKRLQSSYRGASASGISPGAASSKCANSKPGATVQPTSVHSPRLRADCQTPAGTTAAALKIPADEAASFLEFAAAEGIILKSEKGPGK